jgi:hypothetical protein
MRNIDEAKVTEIYKKYITALDSIGDHPITKYLGTWIAHTALYDNKSEMEVTDTGYDVSTSAYKTDEVFDLSKYATLEDFLAEYNEKQ